MFQKNRIVQVNLKFDPKAKNRAIGGTGNWEKPMAFVDLKTEIGEIAYVQSAMTKNVAPVKIRDQFGRAEEGKTQGHQIPFRRNEVKKIPAKKVEPVKQKGLI